MRKYFYKQTCTISTLISFSIETKIRNQFYIRGIIIKIYHRYLVSFFVIYYFRGIFKTGIRYPSIMKMNTDEKHSKLYYFLVLIKCYVLSFIYFYEFRQNLKVNSVLYFSLLLMLTNIVLIFYLKMLSKAA